MKKSVFCCALLLCVTALPSLAQFRVKPETATQFSSIGSQKLPEENSDVWNEFVSEKDGFRVVFPSKPDKVWRDELGKATSFETETARAHYGIMRLNFPSLLNIRQLDVLSESLLKSEDYDEQSTKLISEKNVRLGGMPGKELIFEEAGKVFFLRFYILNQKLFVLSVSLPKSAYTKDFDHWAMKFLDSFGARAESKQFG